jgi:acetate---CoA ligase (ADP-forming) subunit beta
VFALNECETIIQKALQEGRSSLLIPESQQICKLHHIPTPVSHVVQNVDEAVTKGNEIGFPVVLKIISPQILHKSDVGGVVLGIADEAALKNAYPKLIVDVRKHNPNAEVLGVLIEKMMPPSTEVIVGGIRDSQFGPSIMFGMGGVFTEVYKDVAFRVAPLDKIDALNLIHELRGSKIFEGIRGQPPADMDALVDVLIDVSSLMLQHSAISQLDLNPVIAYPDGAVAVDTRIVLAKNGGGV